jgi:hypothetical protein
MHPIWILSVSFAACASAAVNRRYIDDDHSPDGEYALDMCWADDRFPCQVVGQIGDACSIANQSVSDPFVGLANLQLCLCGGGLFDYMAGFVTPIVAAAAQ